MPNVQYFSPRVVKSSSPFPSISRPAVSWLRWWRVIWLALGLWYAWAAISAERKMDFVIGGQMHPVSELLTAADAAVSRYPFDPYLRSLRRYTHEQIARIPPRPEDSKDAMGSQGLRKQAQ